MRLKAKGGNNRGQSLPDFAFSKGHKRTPLRDGKERSIRGKREVCNHRLKCGNRAEGGGKQDWDLDSSKLGLF